MERLGPVTEADRLKTIAAVRDEAMALAAEEIRCVSISPRRFVDEVLSVVEAVKENWSALTDVGYKGEMFLQTDMLLRAFSAAQALWNVERRDGRSEAVGAVVEWAETVREDLRLAAALALRGSRGGHVRLNAVCGGEELDNLVSDLRTLEEIFLEFRPAFAAIKLNVNIEVERLAGAREDLEGVLREEPAGEHSTGHRNMRDRIAVLLRRDLDEMLAFARFAFRYDRSTSRLCRFLRDTALTDP
jgi:hypothetical protein